MCLSDFNSLIELLTGLYFAFFGLQLARTISENKYNSFLSKKESIRKFIESKSNVQLLREDWKKFDEIVNYIKKFENHFEKSSEVFEEMFIYSGLYGVLLLFISYFYDKISTFGKMGNLGLLLINIIYILTLLFIYIKLFKKEIKNYSTFRIVIFSSVLVLIFLCALFFSPIVFLSCLNTAPHDLFVFFTLFSLLFSYILFYTRWKLNSRRLFKEIDHIDDLIDQFLANTQNYILENIKDVKN